MPGQNDGGPRCGLLLSCDARVTHVAGDSFGNVSGAYCAEHAAALRRYGHKRVRPTAVWERLAQKRGERLAIFDVGAARVAALAEVAS